jgi:tetratricopeptide (TPR) repeat protein
MLVGRTQELNTMNASYRQMLEGKGSVLFLTGEAGLGKTTLVHEWWKTVVPNTAIYVEAACSIPIGNMEVGTLEALQPWADVIAQLQSSGEEGKSKKLDLKKLVHDAAPAWAWAIPFVGEIAHAALETTRLIKEQRNDMERNANAANQQQVFQQYVNLLTKISEETPLVILLDDMHWADASSTNLLFYLSRQIPSKRILVLVTYRSDEAIATNNGKGHPIITIKNEILRYESGKEIPLGYLGGEAINELLTKTFGEYQTNGTFETWLRKISDGNSLFVTQFIKTLQEDGHLDKRGTFTGDYDTIAIPSSALAVVTERTRRLDDETRELLSYATAEGEEFTSYVLGQLTSKKPLELLRDLRKAESAGLVQSKKGARQFANQTTSVFGFSHALFHKALYDGLLPEEREILHRQCYEILQTEWDRLAAARDKQIPLATKLLTHAEKCGELEVAVDAALGAAQSAWMNYSESEAMEMLGHVRRLAERPEFPATVRPRLLGDAAILHAQIAELRSRYDEALGAAAEAITYAQTLHDDTRSITALNLRANVFCAQGAYNDSEMEANKALGLAKAQSDEKGKAAALNIIANVASDRCEYEKALEQYGQSLAIRESLNDQLGVSVLLNNIGIVEANRGEYEKALEYHNRSLHIKESIGDRAGMAASFLNIGIVHQKRGAGQEALKYLQRCLPIKESIGDRTGEATTLDNIGIIHFNYGEYDEALKYIEQSLALRESIGDRAGIATSLNNIGIIYFERGMREEALEYHKRSLEMQEALGNRSGVAMSLNNIGNVYYERGEFNDALEYHKRGLEMQKQIGDRSGIALSLLNNGVIYRKLNNAGQSRSLLEQATALTKEISAMELQGLALCELGLLCEVEADPLTGNERAEKIQEAVSLIGNGLSIFHEINAKQIKEYESELERVQKKIEK